MDSSTSNWRMESYEFIVVLTMHEWVFARQDRGREWHLHFVWRTNRSLSRRCMTFFRFTFAVKCSTESPNPKAQQSRPHAVTTIPCKRRIHVNMGTSTQARFDTLLMQAFDTSWTAHQTNVCFYIHATLTPYAPNASAHEIKTTNGHIRTISKQDRERMYTRAPLHMVRTTNRRIRLNLCMFVKYFTRFYIKDCKEL